MPAFLSYNIYLPDMKKIFFAIILMLAPLSAALAQQTAVSQVPQGVTLRIGYFSYDALLKAMPDYSAVKRDMTILRGKYDAEMKRSSDEFNLKYEEFLDGQKDFAPSILKKRQAELRELMEKNIAFKEESERLLAQAEADALAPVHQKLKAAIQRAGESEGCLVILNTDQNAVPFLNSAVCIDMTQTIKSYLK